MKHLKLLILLLAATAGLAGCSKDDDICEVKYVAEGGASDAVLRIAAIGTRTNVDYERVKGRFEYTVVTDAEFVRLEASCDDSENWLKLEIYVNGKRKAQAYGKRYVCTPDVKLR